jgi:ATP-binding cassette subfamily B protein
MLDPGILTGRYVVSSSSPPPRAPVGALKPALLFLRPYRWQLAAATLALVFTATVMLSMGQGLRRLIDNGLATRSAEQLNDAIGLFMVLVALLAVGSYTRYFLVSWLGERVIGDLRKAIFSRLVDLHPGFFDAHRAREIQSRITTDTTLLQTVIGSSVSMALRNLLMFLGGFLWLFATNAKLASIVVGSVPFVVLPIVVFGRRVRGLSRANQDKLAGVGSYVGEALANVKTVQACNHQDSDRDMFSRTVEASFNAAIGHIRQRAAMIALVIFLVMGAVSVMLWVGGHDVMAGQISGGQLAAFVFYAVIVGSSLGVLSETWGDLQRAAGATERLMELLHAESLIQAPAQPVEPARHAGLQISALGFSYPTRPDVKVLDSVNLTITPGTRVALVGPSGAGKSTLFDLILRFYDPSEGAILHGDTQIQRYAPSRWRERLAWVPQQPALFTGSVLDNIRYGRPDATRQEIEEAARAAFAWEFINRLPEGLDTQVGEGGTRLSGGQRQRVAIARALLQNPDILLLDEATSALDAESEHMVQLALERLMKGRTSLVIAHRLATVIDADTIVVMEHGHIIAQGKHADLMDSCPLYARLAELQLSASEEAPVPVAS